MKKLIVIVLTLCLLFACQSSSLFQNVVGIQEVTYDEIKDMMDSSVQFLLYIGRDDCGDCIEFYPILQEYVDSHEETGIYYLNIRQIRDNAKKKDASQEEKDFYEDIYNTFQLEWTPTIEWIKNGKIEKKYQYLDEDYIKISDREEQKKTRNKFIKDFENFMDEYFKEANNEKMS